MRKKKELSDAIKTLHAEESKEHDEPKKKRIFVDPKMILKHKHPGRHSKKYGEGYSDEDKSIVYSYAAYGATNEDIAIAFGISRNTLEKFFKEELQAGKAIAKTTIAQRIYQIAVGREKEIDPVTKEVLQEYVRPNLSALIFLAKTRLGWKETQVVEQNVEVKSAVQFYLPDNGMRCENEERKRPKRVRNKTSEGAAGGVP